MIRKTCLTAMFAATALLAAPSAQASIILAGQVSKVVNLLRNGEFDARAFSYTLPRTSGSVRLFTGIEGIRLLNDADLTTLNDWADEQSQPDSSSSSYKFTHSVVGSYFGGQSTGQASGQAGGSGEPAGSTPHVDSAPPLAPPASENTAFDGEPYKFTHSVLGSYFNEQTDSSPEGNVSTMMIAAPIEPPVVMPVPEPGTWAMIISGLGLVGMAMRRRKASVSFV